MADPTFHAAGTASGSTGVPTPTMPTFTAGDFILIVTESSSTQDVGTITGYTQVTGSPVDDGSGSSAGNPRLGVYWRIAQAGDTVPTIPDSGNHTAVQLFSFSGVDTGSPFSGTPRTDFHSTSTSVSQPGLTTADADCLAVYVLGHAIDSLTAQLSGQANASLTSVTERGDFATNANQGGGFAVTTGVKAVAGDTDFMTGTLAATSKQPMLSFALKPPGAAFVPPPSNRRYAGSSTPTPPSQAHTIGWR